MDGDRTKANTVPRAGMFARCVEATPSKVPVPERAGARTTPTVMLQASGSTSGEDEIE